MTQQVKVYKGDGLQMQDYTPAADIVCGQVVVTNHAILICVNPQGIASGVLGAMVVTGGLFIDTADAAIAKHKRIFWDDTNNKITETASGNMPLGRTCDTASAADGDAIPFLFEPGALPASAAVVAAVSTAAASDLATAAALANANKTAINAILVSLKNAGLMASA